MKKELKEYLKTLMGRVPPNPDKELEELDFTKVMLERLLVPHGFTIPKKDEEKYVIFNNNSFYYPPKEYYGKELTFSAFVDLMTQHKLLPITIGNIRVFQKWSAAKEDWGYSLVFQYLFDSFNIILTLEEPDAMQDQLTLDTQQTKKADSGFNPLDAFVMLCGDCLDIMPEIQDKSIDMILADLPYGTTCCRWDSIIPFEPMWEQLKRVIKPNGTIVMTASQPFTSALVMSNPEMFKYSLVWEKTTATGYLNAKRMPMRAHEDLLVFSTGQPTYNPQKTKGHERKVSTAVHKRNSKKTECYGGHGLAGYDSTERYPRSVIKTSTDKQKSKLHPTQKPVALMEYLIKTYTNEGDTVLDIVMGSGTTGVACKNLNRNFIGIEKDEKYFEIAKQRIKAT